MEVERMKRLIFVLIFVLLLVGLVVALDTGRDSPDSTTAGSNECADASNGFVDDGSIAYCDKGKDQYYEYSSFGVPSGSNITGIKVECADC